MSKESEDASVEQIVLNREPLVAGVPHSSLHGGNTPAKQFFVRNHFPTPSLNGPDWRLPIDGEVESPFELSYEELKALPSKESTILLECAGNSRASIQPPIEGLLWDHSGVSSAQWKGVPVQEVLKIQ